MYEKLLLYVYKQFYYNILHSLCLFIICGVTIPIAFARDKKSSGLTDRSGGSS